MRLLKACKANPYEFEKCSLLRIVVPKFGQSIGADERSLYLNPLINTASLTSTPRAQMSWLPSRDQT